VIGGARAHVFKFVATAVVGKAMTFLERHLQRVLTNMKVPDPKTWQAVDNLSDITLPHYRPRTLLFIHGTFSSTVGSFGALAATPAGRQFLQASRDTFDAVVGAV
jgi:hypothetical protein